MIVDKITALGKIDAVYLDLHGAMVTDGFGNHPPCAPNILEYIGVSSHANISAEITDLVDVIRFTKHTHISTWQMGANDLCGRRRSQHFRPSIT